MNGNLKILITDTNADIRSLISDICSGISGVEVIETAANGRITLAKLRRFPVDLILLDLDIPEMKNLDTVKKIRKDYDTDVVIVSRRIEGNVDRIIEALEQGAIDFVPKPAYGSENSIREFRLQMLTIIGLLQSRRHFRMASCSEKQRTNTLESPCPESSGIFGKKYPLPEQKKPGIGLSVSMKKQSVLPAKIEVVAIAVSTGGPNALAKVIPLLPGNLNVPVLIVQHIPGPFTASLASSLNAKSFIRVQEAVDGDEILPNVAYIAQGGRHITVRALREADNKIVRVCLTDDPPVNSVRPSADVLFRSLPDVYQGNILAVIMTGMGSDGMKGVLALKHRGCYCLSQTADTCTVYGMPRSVDEAGLSDEKTPLERLAPRIVSLVSGQW